MIQFAIPDTPFTMHCPLCCSTTVSAFARDAMRRYFHCATCALIFADPASRLTSEAERARYNYHQNSPTDEGYRQFLSRLVTPLSERLGNTPQHGLDFGCGPGPTLSLMLEALGHTMVLYDPFFAPDTSVLRRRYDFVTCTEAIEHFHTPHREWRLLLRLVKPGGWLGIMTRLVPDAAEFTRWYYRSDPTHVSFFSRATFYYLAQRDRLMCEIIGEDVILLRPAAHHCPVA